MVKEKNSKWLFGTTNIRWGIKELIKLGSSQPSFFSQKRIQSGIAFWVLMGGCIYYLCINIVGMSATDFLLWCAIPCAICGIYLTKIEAAKNIISEIKQEVTITETKTEPKDNV